MVRFIAVWLLFALVISLSPQKVSENETFRWVDHSTIALIEHFEGKRYKAYQDSEGNWTIGIGHLIQPKTHYLLHRELSEDEVMGILHHDLEKCSKALQTALTVPITRLQSDAMHSLCHNIGPDNMRRSDVVKHLNAGDPHKAAQAFMNWSNPPELRKRRKAEKALFLAGT